MSSLQAGILGFISGFAGSKADEADLIAREERAEALRMRKEESALLKERRILKIRGDFKREEGIRTLTEQGLIDESGKVVTTGLDPELAELATTSNITELMEKQAQIEKERIRQGESFVSRAPGSVTSTGAQLTAELEAAGGTVSAPSRPPSRSELGREWNGVKTDARASISNQGGNFGKSERKALSNATLEFLTETGTDEALAYRAMIATQATNSVMSSKDDDQRKQGSNFVIPTSSQLLNTIKEKGDVIDQEFRAATNILQSKMQEEMNANPTQDRTTLARRLINESQSFARPSDGTRITMSPKKRLKDAGLWHESMQDIMFNTLSTVKGIAPEEEEGFFGSLLK